MHLSTNDAKDIDLKLQKSNFNLIKAVSYEFKSKIKYNRLRIVALIVCLVIICTVPWLLPKAVIRAKYNINKYNDTRMISTYECYITETGKCFHAGGCQYLWHSSFKTTVYQAKKDGYVPCSRCTPHVKTIIIVNGGYIVDCVKPHYGLNFITCLIVDIALYNGLVFYSRKCFKLAVKNRKDIECDNKQLKEKKIWIQERDKLVDELGNKTLIEFVGLPPGIIFNSSYWPVGIKGDPLRYTCYYTGHSGHAYHMKLGCSTANIDLPIGVAKHIVLSPCGRCCSYKKDIPEWVYTAGDKLNEAASLLKKYGIPFKVC